MEASGIGRYVHMTLTGYNGGAPSTRKEGIFFNQAVQVYKNKIEEKKRKMRKLGSSTIAQDYENKLNGFLYDSALLGGDGSTFSKEDIELARQEAIKYVNQYLANKWKELGLKLNESDYSIESLQKIDLKPPKNKEEYKELMRNMDTLLKRIQTLFKASQDEAKRALEKKEAPSTSKVTELNKKIELCKKQYEFLEKLGDEGFKLFESNQYGSMVYRKQKEKILGGRTANVMTLFRYSKAGPTSSDAVKWSDEARGGLINRMLALQKSLEGFSASILGESFEELVNYIIQKAYIIGTNEIEDKLTRDMAIKKIQSSKVIGNKSSYTGFLKNNFATSIGYSIVLKNKKIIFEDDKAIKDTDRLKKWTDKWKDNSLPFVVTSTSKVQEKADVLSVNYKIQKSGKVVASNTYLSLKNYDKDEISLVRGTNWATLLQTENNDNYVNHVLNLYSANAIDYNGVTRIKYENRTDSQIKFAHTSLQWIVLLNSLTGIGMLRQYSKGVRPMENNPNYLVINRRNTDPPRVKVVAMSDICKKIEDNLSAAFTIENGSMLERGSLGFYTKNDYPAIRSKNPNWYENAASARISHILAWLRSIKVSARLNISKI